MEWARRDVQLDNKRGRATEPIRCPWSPPRERFSNTRRPLSIRLSDSKRHQVRETDVREEVFSPPASGVQKSHRRTYPDEVTFQPMRSRKKTKNLRPGQANSCLAAFGPKKSSPQDEGRAGV